MTRLYFIIAFSFLFSPPAFCATWYMATNGLDSNAGTSNSPLATITKVQSKASSGDTVYLRGGTYFLNDANITATSGTYPNAYKIVNDLTKNGVSYLAYPGESPVFDFSNVQPPTNRITAFLVSANDCVFKGFDVVGVQVTIPAGGDASNTQSEDFRVTGSRNRFEQLRMHDGMGIGWYLTSGSNNLVLNCDAYNNRGLDSLSIGNVDGFGCHPNTTNGTGNMIAGCRAWFNSDDGYDCINAFAKVTWSNCWAFYNGYFTNFTSSGGDGNGIKAGGYGVSGAKYPTNNIPHHVVEFCLAVSNRANGLYANHHLDGQVWFNNTAYRNSHNYDMLCSTNNGSSAGDVPGYNHVMKNNLGYSARSVEVANLNQSESDVTFNYFTLPVTVSSGDFVSLNTSLLTAPRQTNGDLPYIAFLQLANGSDLVDAGTNINFAYAGSAPDLGAFERGLHSPPTLALTKPGTNLVFILSGGWAGGTNYLIGATDLGLPFAQWPRIVTNKFDLVGNCLITNFVPPALSQQFYRVSLP